MKHELSPDALPPESRDISIASESPKSKRPSRTCRFVNKLVSAMTLETALGGAGSADATHPRKTEAVHDSETKEEKKVREKREKEHDELEKKERDEAKKERERKQEEERKEAEKARKEREEVAKDKLDEAKHHRTLEKLKEPTKEERKVRDTERREEALNRLNTAITSARRVNISAQGGSLYTVNYLRDIVKRAGGSYEESPDDTNPEGKVLNLTAQIYQRNGYEIELSASWDGELPLVIGVGSEYYGKYFAQWDYSRPLQDLESLALKRAYENLR